MLKPNFILENITDISVDFLKENKIKALLLDVDNTLSVAHGTKVLRPGVPEWLTEMQKNGIKLVVLSNAKKSRAKAFANSISLSVVGMALKPLPFGYLTAKKLLNLKANNIAMVGDQIFTDILGANLVGLKTIWLINITPEDKLSFKIRRKIEQKLKGRWNKNER